MKKCNKQCFDLCDFCRFYNFNPGFGGVYTDKGYCVLKEQHMQPEDGCDDFICVNYKTLSRNETSRKIEFLDKKYKRECARNQERRIKK